MNTVYKLILLSPRWRFVVISWGSPPFYLQGLLRTHLRHRPKLYSVLTPLFCFNFALRELINEAFFVLPGFQSLVRVTMVTRNSKMNFEVDVFCDANLENSILHLDRSSNRFDALQLCRIQFLVICSPSDIQQVSIRRKMKAPALCAGQTSSLNN